jgi:hypothetical protein
MQWLVSKQETVRGVNMKGSSPMEGSALVALRPRINPVLSGAQLTEILCCPELRIKEFENCLVIVIGKDEESTHIPWNDVAKKLHFQSPRGCLSNVDVHEDNWSLRRGHRDGTIVVSQKGTRRVRGFAKLAR